MAHFPVPDPVRVILQSLSVDRPAQESRSEWTNTAKIIGLGGAQLWTGSAITRVFPNEASRRVWRAWLDDLEGIINTTDLRAACQQWAGPNPTVRVGAGNGRSLPLQGLPASTTVLVRGQWLTVPLPSGHHRLAMLKADLASNGAGEATATLNVDLGEIPATGATVESVNPYVRVRRTDRQTLLHGQVNRFEISFTEAR